MNRKIITSIIVFAILAAASYIYFSGKGYTVNIPEARLKEKLGEKLPLTKTYLFILEVTLGNPRVSLAEGSRKIDVGLDVVLNIKINRGLKPLGGSIDMSVGVRYEPEKGQFFLTDPVIENLKIQGIPDKYTDTADRALSKAISGYCETNPIYTLKTSDIKQAAAKLVLKDVYIHNKELVIKLGI